MNGLTFVPAAVLVLGLTVAPEAWLGILPLPLSGWFAFALAAVICLVTRQTQWLHALALGVGQVFALEQALTGDLSLPQAAMVLQLTPVVISGLFLFMVLWSLPPVLSARGMLVLSLFLGGLPAVVLWPPAALSAGSPLLDSMLMRPVNGLHWTWLHWISVSVLAVLWAGVLYERGRDPRAVGLAALSLTVWIGVALLDRTNLTGWLALTLAATITVALVIQLVHLAYMDELTGLPQRRALENRLQRLGREATLVMLDVDHFKSFNDSWGHETGDQVLRLLGSLLAREKGVSAFRYGGEEFTLFFAHARQDDIRRQLSSVREKVAAQTFRVRDEARPDHDSEGRLRRGQTEAASSRELSITISLGAAMRRPGEKAEDLLKRADEALYKAKKAGRNRVECDFSDSH